MQASFKWAEVILRMCFFFSLREGAGFSFIGGCLFLNVDLKSGLEEVDVDGWGELFSSDNGLCLHTSILSILLQRGNAVRASPQLP